jgi:sterol desaturase/sphingolipid hydroxylase (fatty acid hydroxylase superfamily)
MHLDAELILLALSPLFLTLIGAEFLYWRRRGPAGIYAWRDTLCNATLALLHQGADKIAWFCTLPLFQWIYQQHHLFSFSSGIFSTVLLFVLQDLLYYGFHRASHRVRWLWAAHSVHHSSTLMNFSTALRQSLMYPLAGMWAFWLPLAWLGFTPRQIVSVVLFNLAFQFFIHTRLNPRLGVLSWLFNTPSCHRCHHARNSGYLDRNYAGVLVIWDRCFGSYVEERAEQPCVYGTVKPVSSFNPLVVTFSEWRDMLDDWRNAPSWRQKLKLLFAPPAILPPSADLGQEQPVIK